MITGKKFTAGFKAKAATPLFLLLIVLAACNKADNPATPGYTDEGTGVPAASESIEPPGTTGLEFYPRDDAPGRQPTLLESVYTSKPDAVIRQEIKDAGVSETNMTRYEQAAIEQLRISGIPVESVELLHAFDQEENWILYFRDIETAKVYWVRFTDGSLSSFPIALIFDDAGNIIPDPLVRLVLIEGSEHGVVGYSGNYPRIFIGPLTSIDSELYFTSWFNSLTWENIEAVIQARPPTVVPSAVPSESPTPTPPEFEFTPNGRIEDPSSPDIHELKSLEDSQKMIEAMHADEEFMASIFDENVPNAVISMSGDQVIIIQTPNPDGSNSSVKIVETWKILIPGSTDYFIGTIVAVKTIDGVIFVSGGSPKGNQMVEVEPSNLIGINIVVYPFTAWADDGFDNKLFQLQPELKDALTLIVANGDYSSLEKYVVVLGPLMLH